MDEIIQKFKLDAEALIHRYLPDYKVFWSNRLTGYDGYTYYDRPTISFKIEWLERVFGRDYEGLDVEAKRNRSFLLVLHEIAHGLWATNKQRREWGHNMRWRKIFLDLVAENNLMESLKETVQWHVWYPDAPGPNLEAFGDLQKLKGGISPGSH